MESFATFGLFLVGLTGLSAEIPVRPSYLRLQVLLDRAHFSPGEIDGIAGENTRASVLAQTTKLRFTHLSIADGLSQSDVRAIAQDRQGFMWFDFQSPPNLNVALKRGQYDDPGVRKPSFRRYSLFDGG